MTTGAPTTTRARAGALASLLLLLAGFAALATLVWMMFLPALVAYALEARTGFGVRIERLAANPFTGQVALTGFAIDNPAAYPSRNFVQMRAFRADAQLFTLFGRRAVFDDVQIDVESVAVIKAADGTVNLDLFRSRLASLGAGGGAGAAPTSPAVNPAGKMEFLIQRLHVRFDRLSYTDLTAPRSTTREFNLGFDHRYTNVSDPAQLLVPALFRRLGESGGALEGLLPARFGGSAGDGAGLLGHAGRKAAEGLKSLFRTLEDSRKP
ncbi:MAG TPA: hypothetical protein VGD81_06685 [Opitutaceae bacterium]